MAAVGISKQQSRLAMSALFFTLPALDPAGYARHPRRLAEAAHPSLRAVAFTLMLPSPRVVSEFDAFFSDDEVL